MVNRKFHSLLIVALICLGLSAPLLVASETRPPNLVVVVTDDQRWDALSLTGNPVVKTPNIDQLAADGIFFQQATITSAICTPSRVSMLLGQYERRHGVNFNSGTTVSQEAWEQSYPVLLRKAGFFTGYIGKNHSPVGEKGYETGLMEKSFDFWYGGHHHLGFYPKNRHPIFKYAKADTQVEILEEGTRSFLSGEDFVNGSVSFLEARPKDQPFALTIAFNVPHGSSTRTMEQRPTDPETYRSLYRDQKESMPLPANYVAKADIKTPRLPADLLRAGFRQTEYDYVDTEESLRERMILYYQTVTGVDQFIGELRGALESAGLADNTVILFLSDHGLLLGEFGLGGKALNYDVCLRVPLIVMDPRLPAKLRGRVSDDLVESVDLAPTLLNLSGVPIPPTMQGESLVPMMEGRVESVRDYSFAENLWSNYFGNPRCESVRSAEWKYIRYFKNDHSLFASSGTTDKAPVQPEHIPLYRSWLTASVEGEQPVYEELFHLSSDPHEAINLASDLNHKEALERLRAECDQKVREALADRGNP